MFSGSGRSNTVCVVVWCGVVWCGVVGQNPEAVAPAPKEYLCYKTRAAEQKLQSRDYKVGDIVDCIDTSNQWLVARIIDVDKEDRVKVHYEGMS